MTPRCDGCASGELAYLPTLAGTVPRLARQVRADLRPAAPAVRRLPQRRSTRSTGRADRRARTGPAACARRGSPHRRSGFGRDVLHLAGAPVVARHLAAVDDVGVERVGRDVAVLLDADRLPLAERDLPVVAAALRRRPTRSPAGRRTRDTGTRCRCSRGRTRAVGWLYQELHVSPPLTVTTAPWSEARIIMSGRVRVDPDPLVVVAARRAAEAGERPAAVGGLPRHDRRHEDDVGVRRMDARPRPRRSGAPPRAGRRSPASRSRRRRPSDRARRRAALRPSRTAGADRSARR